MLTSLAKNYIKMRLQFGMKIVNIKDAGGVFFYIRGKSRADFWQE